MGYKGYPVDIWSAGVCLYAMVYGNVPFKATHISEVTRELFDKPIELKDTVGEEVRNLMFLMLTKDSS